MKVGDQVMLSDWAQQGSYYQNLTANWKLPWVITHIDYYPCTGGDGSEVFLETLNNRAGHMAGSSLVPYKEGHIYPPWPPSREFPVLNGYKGVTPPDIPEGATDDEVNEILTKWITEATPNE